MKNKAVFGGFAFLVLILSLSLSYAYPYNYGGYYGDGRYDSYSYSSSTRYTSEQILPDGTIEKTTHYMRTNRESPNYYGNSNRYYTYPNNYGNNYNNYQPNYYGNNMMYNNYYNDYPPWYQKYWDSNNYQGYSNYRMPMYYSGYAW